jgi:hypothetical protein
MSYTLIRRKARIPKHVRDLFWEYPKTALSWSDDAELVIQRVLESGQWDSVKWLLATTGYAWLKNWMLQHRGAGLDPKRLRFWQLALNLPEATVSQWISENASNPWQQRRRQ